MKALLKKIGNEIVSYISITDKVILFLAAAASCLSCLLIYSLYPESISSLTPVITQACASLIGIACAIFLSTFNYQQIAELWKFFAPIALILCLLTFTPLGQMRGGTGMGSDDQNWLNLGFITIQPSEFLKVAFILTFSLHCFKMRRHINQPRVLIPILIHGAIPILLVAAQGDFGTMLVFLCIFISILFTAGINWKVMAIGGAVGVTGLIAFWFLAMPSYLKERFTAVYNLEATKRGYGLQQYQGRITLGSGGIFGKGLSSDNLLTTTPELYNDMMFAHIGQVFGFFGCLLVIIWIMVICLRLLQNAKNAPDGLGNYICVGVFAVLFFQSVINIGMVLCVFPVIGITLPLFSAGGSSVLSTYLCLGLAMSVHNYTPKSDLF